MLSISDEYLNQLNPDARLIVFGQEYNNESYAIYGSDMMIKDQSLENIRFDDSFTNDGFSSQKFDYMLANPPFGVKWEAEEDFIKQNGAIITFRYVNDCPEVYATNPVWF